MLLVVDSLIDSIAKPTSQFIHIADIGNLCIAY